jgi:hypothetical protein
VGNLEPVEGNGTQSLREEARSTASSSAYHQQHTVQAKTSKITRKTTAAAEPIISTSPRFHHSLTTTSDLTDITDVTDIPDIATS